MPQHVPLLLMLAPAWIIAEIIQLVAVERLVGVARIKAGEDARFLGEPTEKVAATWSCMLVVYWLWMLATLSSGVGKAQLLAIIAISIIGYLSRRASPLKAVIVLMTLEGALRIGMLLSLCILAWKRL